MPVKIGKRLVKTIVKGTVGVVKTATSVGQRVDKLLGTQNMTAFPLQKPTKVKRKSKGGGGK